MSTNNPPQDFVIEVMPWHHGMEEQPIKHWTAFGMKNRRDYDCIPRPACMSPGANLDFSPPRFPDRSRANNAYLIDVHRIYYGHDKRTTVSHPSLLSSDDISRAVI